jgi:hypothetical protein
MDIENNNKEDSIGKLISEIKLMSKAKLKTKTAFLETPELKKEIGKKLKEGIPTTAIHRVIKDLEFSLSLASFRDWVTSTFPKKSNSLDYPELGEI